MERYNKSKKVSIISLITNCILTIAKIITGFYFNSKALIADGIHSLSDIASTAIILFSIKISHTHADKEHPYGHGKAEAIGTIILGVILVITSLALMKNNVANIITGNISRPGTLTLWVAVFSIIAKEGLFQYTIKIGKEINSKGLIADAHHHRSDALSSIAALIGITGSRLGYSVLDPIAGLIVSFVIGKIGIEVFKDAVHELLDGIPSEELVIKFAKQAEQISEIILLKDIKIRTYGPKYFVDLTIVVNNSLSIEEAHDVAAKAKEKLKKQNQDIKDVFVHIDPEKKDKKN